MLWLPGPPLRPTLSDGTFSQKQQTWISQHSSGVKSNSPGRHLPFLHGNPAQRIRIHDQSTIIVDEFAKFVIKCWFKQVRACRIVTFLRLLFWALRGSPHSFPIGWNGTSSSVSALLRLDNNTIKSTKSTWGKACPFGGGLFLFAFSRPEVCIFAAHF